MTTAPDSRTRPASLAGTVVHLVDDDEMLRNSLALLLEARGLRPRCYGAAEELLAVLDGLEPGCLVVDLYMPGMDGLALQQELIRRGCRLPTIVVTGHAEVGLAVRAMKAGAVDFLEKPYNEAALFAALAVAAARLRDESAEQARLQAATARVATLTPREREVLRRLIDGAANKIIAIDLGISPRTVEIHRARLMDKLGAGSLAEALRIGLAAGLDTA